MGRDDRINSNDSAINETFKDLHMFVRDINLNKELEMKYKPGMIIHEKFITDASYKVGGMVTSHRYAIISNSMKDFSMFEQDTNWGLCVARTDAYFKVLDVYTYQDKTQITLLHLPLGKDWKLFQGRRFEEEDGLIEIARPGFEQRCCQQPVPELTTDLWIERCSFPLGMDENGNFYDL